MSERPIRLLLDDVLEAIEKIMAYTHGMSQAIFLKDSKTADAVVRNLEIVGEAANRLPQTFKQQHSAIEWAKIVGLRHRIVHDYFDIDLLIVWHILQKDLPAFTSQLQRIRSELDA